MRWQGKEGTALALAVAVAVALAAALAAALAVAVSVVAEKIDSDHGRASDVRQTGSQFNAVFNE